jgi:cell wall-associated NlpC family hydrolase
MGAAFGATPASAAYVAAEGATSPETTPVPLANQVVEKPVVRLTSNYGTVTAAHAVTFTATEKHVNGTPIAAESATLQVTTKRGWEDVRTKTLSANGLATFVFHPNYNHQYRAVFGAAAAPGGVTSYQPVMTPNVSVTAKPADIGPQIVAAAAKEKGKPYIFDTDGPNTFDCSGLVKFVFAKFGINLPHHADDMKHYGVQVSEKDAKPGDLVFVFSGSYAHHVAIYAGNGYWWEAPHTGSFVRLVKIWSTDIEFRRVR